MKIVLQRVIQAEVAVNNQIISRIGKGYLIFLGIGKKDTQKEVKSMAQKIVNLRIINDENQKMNRSLLEANNEILVVPQFTLYANTKEGRRPSFFEAADPVKAKYLYSLFIQELKALGVKKVASGKFGSYMQVSLINDGPVTLIL